MSLLKIAAKGLAWTTISTIVRGIVQLLQVAILTRFLAKSDFGLVAIATLFLGFTQIFLDLGISAGILHKQDINSNQYSTLFWLNVFTGIILTILLSLFSPFVAQIYGEPELIKVISILSLTILFSSLGSQHKIVSQKKMRFRSISLIEICSSIFTLILASILAIFGFGIYSLVYSSLFHTAFSSLLFLFLGLNRDCNVSFHFKLSEALPFLKIGVFATGSQILDYIARELDILIISSFLGKEILGLYSLCKKIVLLIFNVVNPIITKVLTPLLAEIQGDKERIKRIYYDIVESLALLNFPIYMLIAIFSYGILNFLYGFQYVDGAIPLTFLAITYGLNTTGNSVGCLQVATGRTDSGFYWTIARIVLNIIAVLLGVKLGLEGLSLSLLLMTICVNSIFWRITIYPIIGGIYRDYFKRTILLLFVVILYSLPFYFLCNNMTSVVLCVLIGFLYLFLYVIIFSRIYSNAYLVQLIKGKLKDKQL